MDTIVVGFDGTEPAQRALLRAAELAGVLGAHLVVTHVAGVDEVSGVSEANPADLAVPELAQARTLLEDRNIDAEYQPAFGEVPDAIVEVAERRGAGMIVLGTREPGVVDRLLGHSVSHAVLRTARCDVLVVRR